LLELRFDQWRGSQFLVLASNAPIAASGAGVLPENEQPLQGKEKSDRAGLHRCRDIGVRQTREPHAE
jgi:hypothetical protein